MLPPERQRLILQQLEAEGNVSVVKLKSLLRVSIDTVRRDLAELEKQGKIKRIHGGAVLASETVTNQVFEKRKLSNREQKHEIATLVGDYVKEFQAVALNAGTTNIEVAKELAKRFERLTIITNSLHVVNELKHKRDFTTIVTGGVLNPEEYSLYDHHVVDEIKQFNIDVAILNINAISLDKGLTDFRQGEKEVINAMIESAERSIVAADSSKYDTFSYLKICELHQVDLFITDSQLDETIHKQYEANNITIHKAGR